MEIERRVKRLEWWNRILMVGVTGLLGYGFTGDFIQARSKEEKLIRAQRLEILDDRGEPAIVLGFDDQDAGGLFINDPRGAMRVALAHDASGSALFIRDAEGVVRVGVAQFSHGGGGVALHGPASQGAAVLYFKEKGSLTFYDLDGEPLLRLPEEGTE